MKPGKLSRDVRREQVVQAALRIIARKGARSLTTAAIAEEVGISEANLYRHFRNKDEILDETVSRVGEGLGRNIASVAAGKGSGGPLWKLRDLFRLHLEYIEKNEGIPRLVFSEEIHAGNAALKQKLLSVITTYANALEVLLREGQTSGSVRKGIDARTASLMIIGMIQIVTLRWSLEGFSFPLAAEGMKLWEHFEESIRTEAGSFRRRGSQGRKK